LLARAIGAVIGPRDTCQPRGRGVRYNRPLEQSRRLKHAAAFLREAIEVLHRDAAAVELARAREPGTRATFEADAWAERLWSSEGAEALAEVQERGELPADELSWLVRQRQELRVLRAAARIAQRTHTRLGEITTITGGNLVLGEELSRIALTGDLRSREESCRALETALRPIATARAQAQLRLEGFQYVELAQEESQRAASSPATSSLLIVSAFAPEVLSPPRRDLAAEPWLTAAQTFLEQTDAAADDAVRFLVRDLHGRSGTGAVPWHTLLSALRASELDSEVGRQQRWQRVSAWLRKLEEGEVDRPG